MKELIKFVNNCFEYSHLVNVLETIDKGSLLDVIELKLELIETELYSHNDRESYEKLGTIYLLKNEIKEYKRLLNLHKTTIGEVDSADLMQHKIEILKLLLEFF